MLTSPLRRALQTCALAGYGAVAETSGLLVEMDYGEYEGLTTAEIRESHPGWDLFVDGCPGGETIEDVGRRVDSVIEALRGDTSLTGGDVLIFAHGHVLRAFTVRWLGLAAVEARRLALRAGRIGVLDWEHGWPVLAGWNH